MTAVFKREFKSYFTSPIGYIFIAIMMFMEGFAFAGSYGRSDLSYVFTNSYTFLFTFILIPVLTMRTLSEDRRQKTDQALMTSPVSLWGIVLGKFFATLSVYVMSFAITIVFQVIVALQDVSVNWLVYIGNVLGIIFLGSALTSLGIFVSSLTESQLVSAVVSFAISLLIYELDYFATLITNKFFNRIVEWISFSGRYNTFCQGILDYSNAVFFIGFAAIFLFLTVRVLDKRRYS